MDRASGFIRLLRGIHSVQRKMSDSMRFGSTFHVPYDDTTEAILSSRTSLDLYQCFEALLLTISSVLLTPRGWKALEDDASILNGVASLD